MAPTLTKLILDKSRRLGQAAGPFEIKMSNPADKSEQTHFMQIDGEFMKVKNCTSLTFRLAHKLPNGSLTMLERIDTSHD